MSPLIRAGKLVEEPWILATRRSQGSAERENLSDVKPVSADFIERETSDAFDHTAALVRDTESLSDGGEALLRGSVLAEGVGAGVAAAALTYAEYKERFQQELESQRETVAEEGYREGETRAREQVEAEYAEKLQSLASVLASARQALDNDVEALHEIGAEVVYEAVLKLVGSALVTRAGAHATIREVIKRAKDTTRLIVRLSPVDFEELNGERSLLLENLNGAAVEIVDDERVELGGCLLETPAGNLDGRLEVQLQCLRETLLSARARRSSTDGSP